MGKLAIDPKFEDFAKWIQTKYGVKILNIYTDILNQCTLRLQLIFEHETELNPFFLKNRLTKSTRIANIIAKKHKELFNPGSSQPILLLFYAFEPLAKEEANTKISLKTTSSFKENYKDLLWEIARYGQHVTFFFHTNKQLKEAQKTGLINELKKEYFEILKPFDEFNYFTLASLNAVFDSKENFDKNYDGNWRAYYD